MPVPRLKGNFEYGPMGSAAIRVGRGALQIVFDEGKGHFEIPLKQAPKLPKAFRPGKYFVMVNREGDKVSGISPLSGSLEVNFKEFTHKEGQPPVAQQKTESDFNTGAPVSRLKFNALLSIVNPPHYAGLTLLAPLYYAFGDAGDGIAGIGGTGVQKLDAFLRAAGFDLDKETIPYSDNILPWLQTYLQKQRQVFSVVVKDGWPKEYVMGDTNAAPVRTNSRVRKIR